MYFLTKWNAGRFLFLKSVFHWKIIGFHWFPFPFQVVPDDLDSSWLVVPVPVGKRTLVVAGYGKTCRFTRGGYNLGDFKSVLGEKASKNCFQNNLTICSLEMKMVSHHPSRTQLPRDGAGLHFRSCSGDVLRLRRHGHQRAPSIRLWHQHKIRLGKVAGKLTTTDNNLTIAEFHQNTVTKNECALFDK